MQKDLNKTDMRTLIEINSFSISFDLTLLKDVHLQIYSGEIISLLGPSGSGKTSFLRAICGLIQFSGQLQKNVEVSEIVYVTQTPALWDHLNVVDNIGLVRMVKFSESRKEAKKKAMKYLECLDLISLHDRFPSLLSGGEAQRVSIARGLATEATVLLLDEPTSNIDGGRVEIVSNLLRDYVNKTGKSVVISTHSLKFAESVSNRIFQIENGNLIRK